MLKATLVALVSTVAFSPAFAVFTIDIVQSGGDVIATGSGKIDHVPVEEPGLFDCGASPGQVRIRGGSSVLCTHSAIDDLRYFIGAPSPSNFGTGVASFVGTYSDASFYIQDTFLGLPSTYPLGDSLAFTGTWTGTTIAGLGLTPGTYTWNWGTAPTADSIVLNIVPPPPVPAPTLREWSVISLAGLLALAGFVALRRRRG